MIRTLARAIILAIDRALIRRYRVFEFSSNPTSILRIAFERSPRELILPDGLSVACGEGILALHFHNEHLPAFPNYGVVLGWGKRFLKLFKESLSELASFIQDDPRSKEIRLIWGMMLFFAEPRRIARRFGLYLERLQGKNAWENFLLFWPRLFSLALIWAFNPRSLRGKILTEARLYRIYWPRDKLLALTSKISWLS